jgi:hypothetical protein
MCETSVRTGRPASEDPVDETPKLMGWMRWTFLLLMVAPGGATRSMLDGDTIMRRSTAANRADWIAAPDYAYMERTHNDDGTKTYDVTMILGSSYKRLVKDGDTLLSAAEQVKEERKLRAEVAKREAESPDQRATRIADYQKKRERAHCILEEMPRAFDYTVAATRRVGSRTVYVLRATPRKGYDPPNIESRVLTAMQGEFWIDTITFQWVRASARVLRPVSIAGMFARVQPGTAFEVDQMPVSGDVWLPRHFQIQSRSSILLFFHHHINEEHTYFDYRKITSPMLAGRLSWPVARSSGSDQLLPLVDRFSVRRRGAPRGRASRPNSESGRSVAFNICSRNRPAQCKPVQTDVEAVADWAGP